MIWSPSELRAWAPPPRLTVSQWARAHRRIVSKDAAEPGPWRSERAPYLDEVMDSLGPDDPVQEVYFQKPARVGGTEAINNVLGFYAALCPVPAVLCYPTESDAREQMTEELAPVLRSSAGLAEDQIDKKACMISMPRMNVRIAWPVPSKLTRYTACLGFGDEVNKWAAFAGKEASPVDLLYRRLQTWGHRAKLYLTSTPTTRGGAISRATDECRDRRFYHVPCPACGVMQRLVWAQLKWLPVAEGESKRAHAERIEAAPGAVWYECSAPACRARIDERKKSEILSRGAWLDENAGAPPVGAARRAYFLNGLYSLLGITWARTAARFLRALAAREDGDLGPLMEFVTQVLGEPFEDQIGKVEESLFARKGARAHKAKEVPPWGAILLATADTQGDHFYWMVHAWGRGERCRVIDRGTARTFEELERKTLGAGYPVQDFPREVLSPVKLFIDAGGGGVNETGDSSRTDEVYRFALARPGRVQPVKGWGGDYAHRPAVPVTSRRIKYQPPGAGKAPYDVYLLILDTQALKDVLVMWIAQEDAEGRERVELTAVDDELVKHLTSERKVVVRQGAAMVERWEKIPGRRCDYWDTLVYAVAAAKVEGVDLKLADEAALVRARTERSREKRPDDVRQAPRWVDGSGSGGARGGWWLGGRR